MLPKHCFIRAVPVEKNDYDKEQMMDPHTLLELAAEFDLDDGVLLTQTTRSAYNDLPKGWIISAKDYLLTQRGWRPDRDFDDVVDYEKTLFEETPLASHEFVFDYALNAARFYEEHCTGKGVKPAFQLATVRLLDYLSENFGEKSWKAATEAACSLTSGKGRHDR
jgi:hypothetical protein